MACLSHNFNVMYVVLNHPHLVNNCIKRHINIPTYSASQETVVQEQYVEGMPMYNQAPTMGMGMYGQNPTSTNQGMCGCNQQTMNPMQYQGNVGTEPAMMQQPMMYQFMNNPYNY